MNTDSDYLWDKTGEPDREIQQLEEILGTLRYQPRPLEIPAAVRVGRERSFFRGFGPRLPIAATIAMLLVGLGLWLGLQRLQRRQHIQPSEVVQTPNKPALDRSQSQTGVNSPEENHSSDLAVAPEPIHKTNDTPRRHRVNQATLARNSNRLRNEAARNTQLAANARQGAAAKDQLLLALRMASAKLIFAQKKTQSTNPRDLIHNQHKIG
jgi:hypothetical protein